MPRSQGNLPPIILLSTNLGLCMNQTWNKKNIFSSRHGAGPPGFFPTFFNGIRWDAKQRMFDDLLDQPFQLLQVQFLKSQKKHLCWFDTWMFPKMVGFPPKSSHFNRGLPLPLFLETPIHGLPIPKKIWHLLWKQILSVLRTIKPKMSTEQVLLLLIWEGAEGLHMEKWRKPTLPLGSERSQQTNNKKDKTMIKEDGSTCEAT